MNITNSIQGENGNFLLLTNMKCPAAVDFAYYPHLAIWVSNQGDFKKISNEDEYNLLIQKPGKGSNRFNGRIRFKAEFTYHDIENFIEVKDSQGNLLYEECLGEDDDWGVFTDVMSTR